MLTTRHNNISYLILDIGTSDIKCACVGSDNNIRVQHQYKFPMTNENGSYEIDFDLFFSTTVSLLVACLADQTVKESKVEALLVTSQAQTFVPVDKNFNPLRKGIVWLDERAEDEAGYLDNNLPNFAEIAGFNSPIQGLYVSKLLWLKRNEPDIFKKSRAFPLINEYLVYKLTGKFYSDNVSFGMSGMYDFNSDTLNQDILKILGLSEKHFPEVKKAAAKGELISKQVQNEWNLKYGFPVFLCGNDQCASACGAGLKQPGDVNINFGTAMVFYTITESLAAKLTEDQIAGTHPVGEDYFLLNFESDFGIQIRRLKDRFFENGSYDEFFQTYRQFPNVKEQKPFIDDMNLNFDSIKEEQQFCAGRIKFYLMRFKMHLSEIKKVTDLKNIFISGGMTQSAVWVKIIKEILDVPVKVSNHANAGLIGSLEIYMNRRNGNA